MSNRTWSLLLALSLLGSLLLAACSGDATATSPAAQALLDAQRTAAASSASAGGEALLTIGGEEFTAADLAALPQVTATTDDGDVAGASLTAALEAAGVTAESVTLTAADGSTAEVAVADLDDSALLQVEEDGTVDAVIPTLPQSSWVSDLVSIE